MNDRNDKDAKLLAGAFHDDWADGPAAAFARAAAASARRRRAAHRTLRGATVAAALGAVAFVALRQPPAPAPLRTVTSPPVARSYEIISDDELLAQLRDRPLLMVKKENGEKEFVLLAPEEEPPHGD
jgi:hypothetical protein